MNIFKLSHAFLAVIMIASCNKMITTETLEGVSYITVTSQIGSQTKAGYETKNLPSEFVMNIDQNGTDHDYALLNMSRKGSSNTYIANRNDLAWASTDRGDVSVKAMTMPAGVTEINSDGIVNIKLLSNQTTLESFNKNDILGAKKADNGGITIKGDNINISFQHLMSKLHVVYESTDDSVVEAIALGNVALEGAYSYADMEFIQNNNPDLGSIQMFQNAGTQYGVFAAECIFCPFTPSASSKPFIQAKISGVDSPVSCEITLPSNFSFESGKRYVMKVNVTRSGISQVSLATENDWVKNVPGGKILWIGTSIPAGGGTIYSYPQMIENATGLEIVNNSVGGSRVLKVPQEQVPAAYVPFAWLTIDWKKYPVNGWNHLMAGGLSQTHQEANDTYRSRLMEVSGNNKTWVDQQIAEIQALSYESLIIPYIDGTIDNCNTIVIDHGFNDLYAIDGLHGMSWEAGGFEQGTTIWAEAYLKTLTNKELYNAHKNNVLNHASLTEDGSYLIAMAEIIEAIYKVNKDIKIIIGNYFVADSPWVRNTWYPTFAEFNFTGVLCRYNEALADIWDLDIVNVYEHLEINVPFYNPDKCNPDAGITDQTTFCPDGVHPSSRTDGSSNKAIADVYLQEFAKIFSSTKTKSSSNSYDYGWEDVEML